MDYNSFWNIHYVTLFPYKFDLAVKYVKVNTGSSFEQIS